MFRKLKLRFLISIQHIYENICLRSDVMTIFLYVKSMINLRQIFRKSSTSLWIERVVHK